MFGLNSQTSSQNNVNATDQGLPVGGDDLLPSGAPAATAGVTPQPEIPGPTPYTPVQSVQSASDPTRSNPLTPGVNDDLIEIKKDALQQLTPLVGHLDQSPEEKFRTTMMLIQATDDKSLLKSAYQAALQVPDEKARAQALLDVVNEINYFTHPDMQ